MGRRDDGAGDAPPDLGARPAPIGGEGSAPLTLTMSPRLDGAAGIGWDAWLEAARSLGAAATAAWLARRAGDAALAETAGPAVRAVLEADGPDGAVEPRVELAELGEEIDDLLAETLWEGVMAAARGEAEADALFEATGRVAAIAEGHGVLLAAAEHWIAFLNWRREAGHASDPDQVETAFEEVVRLAEEDGAPKEAALFGFRHAGFRRLVEAEEDRATAGEWESPGFGSYVGWG